MWNYTVNNIWQVTFQSLREVTKICPNKMKHGAFTQLKIAWGKGRGSRHQQTLHLALHQSMLRWDPSGIPPRVLPSWTAQRWWPDHPDGLCSAILLFQEAAVGNSPISMNEVFAIAADSGRALYFLKGKSATPASTSRCADRNFSCLIVWLRFECFNC